jgi:hypothetical protein
MSRRGGSPRTAFTFARLNLSDASSGCVGLLDAEDKEDQARITTERNTSLAVTVGPVLHYPNPPNPDKVFYINKKEAPLLKTNPLILVLHIPIYAISCSTSSCSCLVSGSLLHPDLTHRALVSHQWMKELLQP